jgi:hypothetical protein
MFATQFLLLFPRNIVLRLVMTFLHAGYNSKINLSPKDMLEISQEISRDFTPYFFSGASVSAGSIRLTPKELLDIGQEISRDFAPTPTYNALKLMLLPVDPGHLYAYWHLGDSRPDGSQLTLRVYPQDNPQKTADDAVSWFDVALDSPNTQQQVTIPDQVDGVAYSAAIGKSDADNSFAAIVHSNGIHVPQGSRAGHQAPKNSTVCLGKHASGQGINH